jgi:hypothetical protein
MNGDTQRECGSAMAGNGSDFEKSIVITKVITWIFLASAPRGAGLTMLQCVGGVMS